MMKQICILAVLIYTTLVSLSDTQLLGCPNGEVGLRPHGNLCNVNGRGSTNCGSFPDHVCVAPADYGVCCPRSPSGITCPDGSTGRYLEGRQRCNAFDVNKCGSYPSHVCFSQPQNVGVCCPSQLNTGY